jgi:hypothetical protein
MADEKIGIKQTIRLEWIEEAYQLVKQGLSEKEIRQNLKKIISMQTGSGLSDVRGSTSTDQVVNILVNIWSKLSPPTLPIRQELLVEEKEDRGSIVIRNWIMISVAYPFWNQTATIIGRLSGFQVQFTHQQVIQRLKEQYGDRSTIERYGRYVIRSFKEWGLIVDTPNRGYYKLPEKVQVKTLQLAALLLESEMIAKQRKYITYSEALAIPAVFAFSLANFTIDQIVRSSSRLKSSQQAFEQVINIE